MTDPAGVTALVLAAGLGRRMHSTLPKVLHRVGGRAMVERVLQAARGAGVRDAVVVVGSGAAAVEAQLRGADLAPLRLAFALQAEQQGTGHAALQGLALAAGRTVLILPGDVPLLEAAELAALLEAHQAARAGITLLTAQLAEPTGYGRILRDSDGRIAAIVEERDASAEQRRIGEVFTLAGCFRRDLLAATLAECRTGNAQGEIYLTDTIALARARGERVEARAATRAADVLGVNDRRALAQAEAALRARTLDRLLEAGVTVEDAATTFVDEAAQIAADTTLRPMTVIEGPCVIGPRCELGPGAHVRASRVDADCRIWHSVVEESALAAGCLVGPFAHLRRGTSLGRGVEVGNFAEVKNAALGDGTKQHHHSYVGDAELGAGVNVGAGAITVNFDGRAKHRTVVGDGAFLGCNANLVAPVRIGRGAFVAAGSTITRPVPEDALGIGRAPQEVREGWAARRRRAQEAGGPGQAPEGPAPGGR